MIAQCFGKAVGPPADTAVRSLIVLWMVIVGVCVTASSQRTGAGTLAATIDLQAERQMVTPISRNWRFCGGDDHRWADPALDDSMWKVLQPTEDWNAQGYAAVHNLAWFRIHLSLPASMPSLVLFMPRLGMAYQIFADGNFAGQAGRLPPAKPEVATRSQRIFTLPLSGARRIPGTDSKEILVAIRV